MGSARVQYELERTLPSLKLAFEHGIFDKETEIRSITHKRRQFESALVRRHALSDDFHNYLDYEEDLEKLLKIRLKRIQSTEDIPRSEIHKIQNDFIRHLISIFERSIKRLKNDFSLWQRYINWAKERNMRGAISRISARALSLFPNNVQLWLSVADQELNVNLNPSTARALLQRGLRLNGVAHQHSIIAYSSQRANKRAKLNDGQTSTAPLTIRSAGDKYEDTPTFNVAEREYIASQLWLEYIRMEFVFLERIRRRKVALNILDNKKASREIEEEGSEEKEDVVGVERARESIADIAKAEQSLKGSNESQSEADLIVLGAIPITAIKSALSLDSSVCLPPTTHFSLLTSIRRMVDQFPFYGDASELRKRLHSLIEDAIQDRFDNHPTAILFRSCLSILYSTSRTGMESLGEIELKEELGSSNVLRKASRLRPFAEFKLSRAANVTADKAMEADTLTAQNFVFKELTTAMSNVQSKVESANLIRSTLKDLRKQILALTKPEVGHISVQLRLVQYLRPFASESLQLGQEFDAFLEAYSKRILQDAKRLGFSAKESDYL